MLGNFWFVSCFLSGVLQLVSEPWFHETVQYMTAYLVESLGVHCSHGLGFCCLCLFCIVVLIHGIIDATKYHILGLAELGKL